MIKEQVKKIGTGIVTNQDILENQASRIYLGIGSNLGNRRNKIEQAKYELSLRNIPLIIKPFITLLYATLGFEPIRYVLNKFRDFNNLFFPEYFKTFIVFALRLVS